MVTVSVALPAATAVAAVYAFLLVLPDNCHHVVLFRAACRWDFKSPMIGGKSIPFHDAVFPHHSRFMLKKKVVCLGQRWVGSATP